MNGIRRFQSKWWNGRSSGEASKTTVLRTLITSLLIIGSLIGALHSPLHVAAAAFDPGDEVIVADGPLNLRDDDGTDAGLIMQMATGTPATVLDGPVSADGYSWYELQLPDATTGWAAGDFLAYANGDFGPGDGVRVISPTLNVRNAPGLDGDVTTTVSEGIVFTIASGPTSADGYTWYKVHSFGIKLPLPSNLGWVAGEFLAYDARVTGCEGQGPCPTGLSEGDGVRVATDGLNLRSAPGTDTDILATLPGGATGTVLDFGNGLVDGYGWIKIATDFGQGWVASQFIVADPSASGSPEYSLGESVYVANGPLTVRNYATTASDAIDWLPDGTDLTIEDGPIVSDGYTWYEVSSDDYETGWVAGEFLAAN